MRESEQCEYRGQSNQVHSFVTVDQGAEAAVSTSSTPSKGAAKVVHFPPVPNGIDYLVSVVGHLKPSPHGSTPRDLKYAVLHLQAASEVLLKARLQFEHWTLTVKDASKTDKSKHGSGEFESPTTAETLRRLTDVLGIQFDKKDKDNLLGFARMRNALQHWGLTESAPAVESRAADVLDFLIRFFDDHLLDILEPAERSAIQGDLDLVRGDLNQISGYVKSRMNRLRSELGNLAETIIQCPDCTQFALVVDGHDNICRFCMREWEDYEELVQSYASWILNFSWRDVTRGGESPIFECPSCEADALVIGVVTPSGSVNICFNCLDEFMSLDKCMRCDRLFVPEESELACAACFAEMAAD